MNETVPVHVETLKIISLVLKRIAVILHQTAMAFDPCEAKDMLNAFVREVMRAEELLIRKEIDKA